jgi:hypothetical protein
VNEAPSVDEAGGSPGPSDPENGGVDRLDLLEEQVHHLAARLAGWVEHQLVQTVDARRADMRAFRSEILSSVDARLAESSHSRDADDLPARIEGFEQRVKGAMGRLTDSVETRLAETTAARNTELEALRSALGDRVDRLERDEAAAGESVAALRLSSRAAAERTEALEQQVRAAIARLEKSLEARVDGLVLQVAAATDGVAALQADADAAPARAELLEQRVRSAMGRLAESVEARLAEVVASRPAELAGVRTELEKALALQSTELRTEIETVAAATRARASQVQERLDAVEQLHRDADHRFTTMVEAKLAEVVDRRRAEMEALRHDLEETLSRQVREARTEIGTAVADAHRRFVVAVDELEERMAVVIEQAASAHAAVASVEALPDAVASDGRRIEALEEHTRRTDARLGELVDAKLAEVAAERVAEIADARDQMRASVDAQLADARDQLRASVDAHLVDTRSEVAFTLAEGRTEVAAGTNRVEEALAAVDTIAARVERLMAGRLEELEKVAADVVGGRAEVAAAVAALDRRAADAEDQARRQVGELAVQVGALVKTASTEGGTLAPLRSDIRMLQAQVMELTEAVTELRPRRKAAAAPALSPAKKAVAERARRAAAPAKTVVPAKKTVPAKTAAGRRRAQ